MVLNVISGTHSLPMKMINFLYTLRMKSHNDIAKEEKKIVESSRKSKNHIWIRFERSVITILFS